MQDAPPTRSASDFQRCLWEEYSRTRSPNLREQLEIMYLGLVKTLAEQLSRRLPGCVEIGDLEQEGFLGLRRAVERFQLQRAVKFTTYAQSAIWGAMMDSLRRDDPGTRESRRRAAAIEQQRGRFQGQQGRPPTEEELARSMGLEDAPFAQLAKSARIGSTVALATVTDSEKRGVAPADTETRDPVDEVQWRDLRDLLLRGFDATERLIVILYYFEELSMREIGKTLGISESRVSQLHSLVVQRIKADLRRRQIDWH